MTDLMHKRCEYPGCMVRPIFGYEGGPTKNCSRHRQEGMIKLQNNKPSAPGQPRLMRIPQGQLPPPGAAGVPPQFLPTGMPNGSSSSGSGSSGAGSGVNGPMMPPAGSYLDPAYSIVKGVC
jgi:EsV-1-7 cysteine-rich motif